MTKITLCHNILTLDGWIRSTNLKNNHMIAVLDKDMRMFYSNIYFENISYSDDSMCFIKSKNVNLFVSLNIKVDNENLSDLIGKKKFKIKKTSNGISNKNVNDSTSCGTFDFKTKTEADKKQIELIEQGYSADREIVVKFNDTVGHKITYKKDGDEEVLIDDYIYIYQKFNDVIEIKSNDPNAVYFLVERCGKIAWIPL